LGRSLRDSRCAGEGSGRERKRPLWGTEKRRLLKGWVNLSLSPDEAINKKKKKEKKKKREKKNKEKKKRKEQRKKGA